METNPQTLVKRYNDYARRFKIIYALSKHYFSMGIELSPEESNPPTDLNQVYGKLNIIRKMMEQPTPTNQAISLLDEIDYAINSAWQWFELIDRKLTPFLLRSYSEQNKELAVEHILLIAQFLLNKNERLEIDQGKIDYLLTQSFCIETDGLPRLRVASEQSLKEEILKLLPDYLRYDHPNLAANLEQCDAFIRELMGVNDFDSLISGDYINKGRQLKSSFGAHFYNANVLAKCVQVNTVLRQKFSQLYKAENEKIRQFSQILVNTGMDLVQTEQGGEITAESAMEFSNKTDQMMQSEYSGNAERLRTFVKIRDTLDKTIAFYGLDPQHSSGNIIDRDLLNEQRLATKVMERCNTLRDVIRSLPERPNASVQVIDLESSRLILSNWEKEALMQNNETGDPDTRLSIDLLGRSAAIIAEINESYVAYRSAQSSTTPNMLDTQLMTINYFIMQAHQTADELEKLTNRMRELGRIEKACDLSATRHKLLDTCWKIKI
ncbi:MAG: hypothetical protein HY819_09790 [Acidobacteria bacterium]|nr:hypothetical protein [Acidobacteriota bacterium]